jgi:MFS family permease
MVLSFVSSFVGYSQLNAGMPAFARAVGEVSTQGLGLAFAANTVVIVLLQLVVLHRIEGRRRTRVIAVMGLQPTIPALVNDLAPDHLRGRYNALNSASFSLAAIIAPPIAGALVGHHLGSVYVGMLVAGSLVCGALAVLHVEPQLPPGVNGVRVPAEEDAEEVVFVPTPTGAPSGALD